jgi:putative tail protein
MGKSAQVIGYTYYLGLHFGMSHGPVDEFLEIRAGDRTAWSGSQTASGTIVIDAPNLFGGPQKEGGILGNFDVMMGEATQGANAYLSGVQGPPQPGYRGLLTGVFNGSGFIPSLSAQSGQIGANNPYPKAWSFRFRRALMGWFGGSAWNPSQAAITLSSGVIGMNPAHMVYETLTNPDWGMGYPSAALDLTVFSASAAQLFSEGLGLCLLWNRQDTIDSWLQTIMNYTAGVLVTSPVTGLFQYKLVRGGYDVSTLPVFTQSDILELSEKDDSTLTGAVNELWVKYYDPLVKQEQSIALQALGSIQSQGVVVTDTRTYTGIATQDLAARICQRDLQATTVPLKRLTAKFKRTAYLLTPGDVFVLSFPAAKLNAVVMRVGEVDTGTLLDGSITMSIMQDIYSLPSDTYVAPQVSGWIPPNNHPVAAVLFQGYEADFRTVYKMIGSAIANALPPLVGYDGVLVARPDSLCQSYALATEVGGAAYFALNQSELFAPSALLAITIGPFDTSMTLETLIDIAHAPLPCAALIVDGISSEIVNVTAFNATTLVATIARGCVDTVSSGPTGFGHAAGLQVFFLDNYVGSDGEQYTASEVVHNKPLPNAPLGQLDISLAADIPVTIAGRALLPYPPALPKINGTRFDLATPPTGAFTLSWIERNRLTQADVMVDQTMGTVTPEAGTTYTVRVYSSSAVLLATYAGIAGTSQLINSGASDTLTLQLEAQCNGLTSLEHWVISVAFTNNSVGMTDEGGTQLDTETNVDIWSE